MTVSPMEFTLTADHIKLIRAFYVEDRHFEAETGAPYIDPKRPYGNSFVYGDVVDLLKLGEADDDGEYDEELIERAREIHEETQFALQIVLFTGSFKPGKYRRPDRYDTRTWEFVSEEV